MFYTNLFCKVLYTKILFEKKLLPERLVIKKRFLINEKIISNLLAQTLVRDYYGVYKNSLRRKSNPFTAAMSPLYGVKTMPLRRKEDWVK